MDAVRAKFYVQSKLADADGNTEVELWPVYANSPENESFFRYTPAGQVRLFLVRPGAAKFFETGKEYYLDFTPAN